MYQTESEIFADQIVQNSALDSSRCYQRIIYVYLLLWEAQNVCSNIANIHSTAAFR
jgi:hypothetical protein